MARMREQASRSQCRSTRLEVRLEAMAEARASFAHSRIGIYKLLKDLRSQFEPCASSHRCSHGVLQRCIFSTKCAPLLNLLRLPHLSHSIFTFKIPKYPFPAYANLVYKCWGQLNCALDCRMRDLADEETGR